SRGRLSFGDPTMNPEAESTELPRTFELHYEFDGKVMFRHAQPLQKILAFARQSGAKQLTITGYRAASLLSNGERMLERPTMGQQRAEQVAELLKGAGLTDVHYELHWKDVTREADGVDDSVWRKVEVIAH